MLPAMDEAERPEDAHWMGLALAEARQGIGKTAPNPPVGAVVVKQGALLGAGWHRAAGLPHAEREALADAVARHGPEAVRGATVYVTLEPCSTQGRTPPCTAGLIEVGVARVVYACDDRHPAHLGRARALLEAAGIAVTTGVGEEDARRVLRPFFKVRDTGLPWVIWKTAMSLDGRLTRPPGEDRWLTGEAARADVQRLRATVDAILTTGETVRRDRPRLDLRDPALLAGRQQPWRVVFTDRPESLPRDAPLFVEHAERTLLRPRHGVADSLRRLAAEQGVLSAMTEAGGVFAGVLFEAGLVDEVVVYCAPLLTGGPVAALAAHLPKSLRLEELSFERLGDDVRLRGTIARGH